MWYNMSSIITNQGEHMKKQTLIIAIVVTLLAIIAYFIIPAKVVSIQDDLVYKISNPYTNVEEVDSNILFEYLESRSFKRKFGRGFGINKEEAIVIKITQEFDSKKPIELVYSKGDLSSSYLSVGKSYFKLSNDDEKFIHDLFELEQ